MVEYTGRLGLKKPDETEFYNVADFNYNMDILDALTPRQIGAVKFSSAKTTNIDTLIADGVYRLGEDPSVPSNLRFGTLLVMNGTDSETYSQIGVSYAHSVMMYRGGIMSNGTVQWGTWRTVADREYAAPKSLVYDHAMINTNEELDTALLNWFNAMGSGEIKNFTVDTRVNGLSIPGGVSIVTINKPTAYYGVIEVVLYNDTTPALRICSVYNGALTEWREIIPFNSQGHDIYRTTDGEREWISPPMMPGVEYRTTKRHNGQPVYTKLINFGALQRDAGQSAWISMGTSSVISLCGIATWVEDANTTYRDTFPIHSSINGDIYAIAYIKNDLLIVKSFDDKMINYTAQFVIEYTK